MHFKYVLFHYQQLYIINQLSKPFLCYYSQYLPFLSIKIKFIEQEMQAEQVSTPIQKKYNPENSKESYNKVEQASMLSFSPNGKDLYGLLVNEKQPSVQQLERDPKMMLNLVKDNHEVNLLKQIIYTEITSSDYNKIILEQSELLDLQRVTRLKTVFTLKKSKNLNIVLVKSLGQYLQDILQQNFEHLSTKNQSSSKYIQDLYGKINAIKNKLMSLKKPTHSNRTQNSQMDQLEQLLKQNSVLKINLNLRQTQLSNAKYEINSLFSSLNSLKNNMVSQQNHFLKYQEHMLHLKANYISQLQEKELVYQQEISQLSHQFKVKEHQFTIFYEEINYNIQDFKSLILKLNNQNKILKEEKELLMSKIDNINKKLKLFARKINVISQECQRQLQSERDEDKRSAAQGLIEKLQYEIYTFKNQIENKDRIIEQMTRKINNCHEKDVQKDAEIYTLQKFRQKETAELKLLKENIQTLKSHLLQTGGLKHPHPQSPPTQKDNQHQQLQYHQLTLQNHPKNNGITTDEGVKLKLKIKQMEQQLKQQRQTVKSLNDIIQDLYQLQKIQNINNESNGDQMTELRQQLKSMNDEMAIKNEEMMMKDNELNTINQLIREQNISIKELSIEIQKRVYKQREEEQVSKIRDRQIKDRYP